MRTHTFSALRRKPVASLLGLSLIAAGLFLILAQHHALAANPTSINFQGKVVNADGTNVTNGTYTFVFRLYDNSSPTIGANCNSNSQCWWEETDSLSVTNGVFQVELGSASGCLFTNACNSTHSGIDWNTNNALYLTMKFNGDTSGTSNGFMTPVIHFQSAPYAFNADKLGGLSSSGFIQNQSASPQSANFNVQSAASGSVTATIQGASSQSVDITQVKANGIASSLFSIGNTGNATFRVATSNDSTTAFQVQKSDGTKLLDVDSINSRIAVDATYSALATPSGLAAGAATSGGSLTFNHAYYYKITAVDSAGGETAATSEVCLRIANSGTNQTIPLTWTVDTGASGYKIYRSDGGAAACSSSNTEVYLTTVIANSFSDSGSITAGSSTAPSTNNSYVFTTNTSKDSQLSLTVGGNGTPTGQLYVGGTIPSFRGSTSASLAQAASLAVQGRYAYVLDGSNPSLNVYDVSNPSAPALVGSTTSHVSVPNNIAVQGKYAYVVDQGIDVLLIYDISNPGSPTWISSMGGFSLINKVAVQGKYAFVLSASPGVSIVDISNPATPKILSSINKSLGTNSDSIYIQGNYAYVTDRSTNALVIYSFVNPLAPTLAGSTTTGLNTPHGIQVVGRYAYIASGGNNSLVIDDISNPSSPSKVGSVSTSLAPSTLAVEGRYAYMTDGSTLAIIDVSNPASPQTLGTQNSGLNAATVFIVKGRYGYVKNTDSLAIYDLGGAYIQQLEAGAAEINDLSVTGNGSLLGDFDIRGGLQVGQSIQTSSSLGVAGGAVLQGSIILNSGNNTLGTPSAPTVACSTTVTGCTTSTSWAYKITAINSSGGETAASSAGSISASDGSTLSTTTFNHLTWTAVTGASGYRVYRTTAGGTPSTTGYIATATTNSFDDKGFFGDSTTASSTDTTGQLSVFGSALFKNTTNSATAFQVQNASGVNVLAVDTTTSHIKIFDSSNVAKYVDIYYDDATSTAFLQASSGIVQIGGNAGPVTIDTGSGDAVNITGRGASTWQIIGASLTIQGGTTLSLLSTTSSAISLDSGTTGGVNVGTGANAKAVAIGSTTSGTTIDAEGSTIDIGDSTLAKTIHIGGVDAAATETVAVGSNATSVETITVGTTNSTSSLLLQGGSNDVTLTTSAGNTVQIGSGTTDANVTFLQLDSDSDFSADEASCTTSSNQGAMYYNTTTKAIRSCVNSGWEDLVTTAGLGLMLFGVVPDSGTNPGDLASQVTAGASGPCKVSYLSASSVSVEPCIAYSGGRKVVVASTSSVTGLTTASHFYHICFDSTTGLLTALNGTSETNALPTFSVNNPILCLADVQTNATPVISAVYDTRAFTTSIKEPETVSATAAGLGMLVTLNTPHVTKPAATAALINVMGVVVATDGATSTTSPNAIVVVEGPAVVKATAGTAGAFIETGGTTAGYAITIAANGTATQFTQIGYTKNTFPGTSCTVTPNATNCNRSLYFYAIRGK